MFEQCLQEHRRRPPQRGRLYHRVGLHRADFLAPLPEIPRRARAGQADEAALERKKYSFLLDKLYRWDEWAAPKAPGKNPTVDHNRAKTGDDLRDFVNGELFPDPRE
jgi:hypothetical protein